MLYTIKTAGGWTYSGVEPWELKRLIQEIQARGDSVTTMQKIQTPPTRYDLNTVYFPNRDELKWKLANTDPQLQARLRQKARELYQKYLQIAKSYDQDIQKYPKAAQGLRKSQQMFYQRAKELLQFANGQGQAPKWFADLFVNQVTGTQLHEIGYDPSHPKWLTFTADGKPAYPTMYPYTVNGRRIPQRQMRMGAPQGPVYRPSPGRRIIRRRANTNIIRW